MAYLPDAYWGLMHFGTRPVFGEETVSWEILLLDFERDTEIPQMIDVEVHKYLRKVMNFKSPEDMLLAIEEDVKRARNEIKALEKKLK